MAVKAWGTRIRVSTFQGGQDVVGPEVTREEGGPLIGFQPALAVHHHHDVGKACCQEQKSHDVEDAGVGTGLGAEYVKEYRG